MPLLDHFHPPLSERRHWESFYAAWTTRMIGELNLSNLPEDYFGVPRLAPKGLFDFDDGSSAEPDVKIDVASTGEACTGDSGLDGSTPRWVCPPRRSSFLIDFAQLDVFEVRVYQELGGRQLRGVIELVSPRNKDRAGSRRTFAAKCAGYLQHGIGVVIVDVVTVQSADLHAELVDVLEVNRRPDEWRSSTGLYAVAYRPVTVRKSPRVEVWTETLTLGQALPVMPLWLALDLCVPVRLEESYVETCRSLRIPA
jgi:hypothetical protein